MTSFRGSPQFALLLLSLTCTGLGAQSASVEKDKIEYLKTLLPSLQKLEDYAGDKRDVNGYYPNYGWRFDADLGWTLRDAIRDDGIDGSKTFYHYEPTGARKRVNFPDTVARIHSYGDSFTHCDQVNDGETWQEYLAAHLGEPVENYGVGGYSVYQAYLRMKKVESAHPAQYVILNVFDDDHFRNLDSWRNIRSPSAREGPLPYVRVNVDKNEIVELPNPCRSKEDLYKLRDLDWVLKTFGDDVVLHRVLATRLGGRMAQQSALEAAVNFGLRRPPEGGAAANQIQAMHLKASLFATIKILGMAEQYVKDFGKKLFVVLSYGKQNVDRYLRGEKPFDQELIDYLKTRSYPYVDLREAHLAEFKTLTADVDVYLDRYYIGHYGPAGNFFTARAIKNKLVSWLAPPPKTYRKD